MRPVFASPFLVRLRDRGAWPSLSHISHFFLTSRIFISHLAFLSRIFISHLAFLSRISDIFYLASRIFISHLIPEIIKGWFTLATESEAESESEAQEALRSSVNQ